MESLLALSKQQSEELVCSVTRVLGISSGKDYSVNAIFIYLKWSLMLLVFESGIHSLLIFEDRSVTCTTWWHVTLWLIIEGIWQHIMLHRECTWNNYAQKAIPARSTSFIAFLQPNLHTPRWPRIFWCTCLLGRKCFYVALKGIIFLFIYICFPNTTMLE